MYRQWLIDGLRQKGRSQAALARHLGLSDGAVSRICSGGRRIQADELVKIAEFLGLPVPIAVVPGTIVTPAAVPVRWISVEGAWLDIDSLMSNGERTGVAIAVPADPRHRGLDRYAVQLRDLRGADTVRRFAICASADSLGRKVRAGDTIHCTLPHPSTPSLLQSLLLPVAENSKGELELDRNGEPHRIPLNKVEVIGVVIGRTESYDI